MRLIDADKLIKDGWVLTKHGESNTVTDIKSIADVPTEREFDALYEECRLQQDIKDMVSMVIREHLIKVGLLNEKDESG